VRCGRRGDNGRTPRLNAWTYVWFPNALCVFNRTFHALPDTNIVSRPGVGQPIDFMETGGPIRTTGPASAGPFSFGRARVPDLYQSLLWLSTFFLI
jgi:hypothetical protein